MRIASIVLCVAAEATAIARQIAAGRQEVEDDVLETLTPETLQHCTIEAAANLELAMQIIRRG